MPINILRDKYDRNNPKHAEFINSKIELFHKKLASMKTRDKGFKYSLYSISAYACLRHSFCVASLMIGAACTALGLLRYKVGAEYQKELNDLVDIYHWCFVAPQEPGFHFWKPNNDNHVDENIRNLIVNVGPFLVSEKDLRKWLNDNFEDIYQELYDKYTYLRISNLVSSDDMTVRDMKFIRDQLLYGNFTIKDLIKAPFAIEVLKPLKPYLEPIKELPSLAINVVEKGSNFINMVRHR